VLNCLENALNLLALLILPPFQLIQSLGQFLVRC
jgi:hypothetical protein